MRKLTWASLLSRHRLGDTEVSGQTEVFIRRISRESWEQTRGEYVTERQCPDGLACDGSLFSLAG